MDKLADGFFFGLGVIGSIGAVVLAILAILWVCQESFWWRRSLRRFFRKEARS